MQNLCIETGFSLYALSAEGYSNGLTLVRIRLAQQAGGGRLLLGSHPSAKSPWLPADPAQPAGVAEAPRPPCTSATGTGRSASWIWGMRLFPTFKNRFEKDEGRNPSFLTFFFFPNCI